MPSPHVWTPSLVPGQLGQGREPEDRSPAHALGRRRRPEVPATVHELGQWICIGRWQDAVAWRLSGALDEASWASLRRRPPGLCRRLAVVASEIEEASARLGEAAGLATVEGLRRLGRTRLVRAVAQAAVAKVVPPPGESRRHAVVRCLLVTGVWLCVADGRHLRACTCFEALARGRSPERVGAELRRHLSGLRAQPPRR